MTGPRTTSNYSKHRGALSEHIAIVWLLQQGYEVFRNVSQHGPADIVAWKPETGERLMLDVKTVSYSSVGNREYVSVRKRTDAQRSAGVLFLMVCPRTGNVSIV